MTLREELHAATVECWRTYAGSAEFWEDLRADWELEKRHPTTAALHRGLVSGRPVPEWAADYIVGRLDGTVKLPRGRPPWSDAGLTFREAVERGLTREWLPRIRRTVLLRMVAQRKRVFEHPDYANEHRRKYGRLPPMGSACEKALSEVSKETGVPAATLRNWYYRRRG